MTDLPLWRQAQLSGCWSKSPLGWIQTGSIPSNGVLSPHSGTATLRRASQSWQAWFRPWFRLCCMLRQSQQAGQSPRQFSVWCLQDHLQPDLPLPFSETFTLFVVELTLLPLYAHPLSSKSSSVALVWCSNRARGTAVGTLCRRGCRVRWCEKPGQFRSTFCPLLWEWGNVCALHRWSLSFLPPSSKSHWFSEQLKGQIFWRFTWTGVPSIWLEATTLQGGSQSQWQPLHLLRPLVEMRVPVLQVSLPPYLTVCSPFFTALVVEEPPICAHWKLLHAWLCF